MPLEDALLWPLEAAPYALGMYAYNKYMRSRANGYGGTRNVTSTITYPSRGYKAYYPHGYNRAAMPRRGSNRLISRKRPGVARNRRRLSYGTSIRKQALGLFEGWKYVEPVRVTTPAGNVVTRTRLIDDLHGSTIAPAGGTTKRDELSGREMFVRGIKLNFLVTNNSTTAATDVRIILGWRKMPWTNTDITGTPSTPTNPLGAIARIFKNTVTGQGNVDLGDCAHGTSDLNDAGLAVKAPIDKRVFHCEKDFVFRLGPNSDALEQVYGGNQKRFSIWWELNNKRYRLKENTQADVSMDQDARELRAYWYPVMYYYHAQPHQSAATASTIQMSKSWVVYYKDPS